MRVERVSLSELTEIKKFYSDVACGMQAEGIELWDDVYPGEFLAAHIERHELYCVRENHNILAAFALTREGEGVEAIEWTPTSSRDQIRYLYRFAVNAQHKREGIGSIALKSAMDTAREQGATVLRLFVETQNAPALHFYQRQGLEKRPGVYVEVVDETLTLREFGFEKDLAQAAHDEPAKIVAPADSVGSLNACACVRLATPHDAEACRAIYAQYITSATTFESTLPSIDEFTRRIQTISARYPYLVIERNGIVIGYAYAHEFKERAAYQWSSELSIYLDGKTKRNGLGKALYVCLINLVQVQGVRTVYGIVTMPNFASEKLHESLGFIKTGTMHNSGYKDGAWHDVAWFEKPIAPYTDAPEKLIAFSEIATATIDEILASCNASLARNSTLRAQNK